MKPASAATCYDACIFDIDGTLLHCADAVHYSAFCKTLTTLAGRSLNLDGVTTHGNTDIGILRDALRLAGVPEKQWRPRIAEIRDTMAREVSTHADEFCVTALPAAGELLNRLRAQGVLLGVASGNLEAIGQMKLSRCNLLDYFDFFAFSDAYENRTAVFQSAVRMVHERLGSHAQICVFGDTPQDVRAARANGLDVVAVATGIYSFEQLQAEDPDQCLHSLAEWQTALHYN